MVGGVTPGKGGEKVHDLPVFDTVAKAVAETGANATMIFVPPAFYRRRHPGSDRRRDFGHRRHNRRRSRTRHGQRICDRPAVETVF